LGLRLFAAALAAILTVGVVSPAAAVILAFSAERVLPAAAFAGTVGLPRR
jgi:hypothetical protein